MGRLGKKWRKKRQRAIDRNAQEPDDPTRRPPKSFVMRTGELGKRAQSLVKDWRQVLRPYSATSLQERKRNTLRDFLSVAGPLGITQFLMFHSTDVGVNMRLARVPRGPTLTFRVDSFSTMYDVLVAQSRPYTPQYEFIAPPLVVMSNFNLRVKEQSLMSTAFQAMFPTINVHTMKLSDCKRVVLFNYDADSDCVEFRHYVIKVTPVGLSKSVKRLIQAKIPDLSKVEDIADYVLQGAHATESDMEDAPESRVTVKKVIGNRFRKQRFSQTSAIRLREIGPRCTLQLIKIEEGCCDGEVLYHRFEQRSSKEVDLLRRRIAERDALKAQRRAEQEQNRKRKAGQLDDGGDDAAADDEAEPDEGEDDDAADDDAKWFRAEVGIEPSAGELAVKKSEGKRAKFNPFSRKKQKTRR